MSDVPSEEIRIQQEAVRFRSPVSESLLFSMGAVSNFILDHFTIYPGMIIAYGGLENSVPSGWHVCDGRQLNRTTYANLFAAIGTLHGVGDGITTFNMPDMRGLFLRMTDQTAQGTSGRDIQMNLRIPQGTGNPVEPGSLQFDSITQHSHSYGGLGPGTDQGSGTNAFDNNGGNYESTTSVSGGAETRPKNYYVLYLIKD